VLAPRPSYPLVEHLADLDAVSIEHFGLEFHEGWAVDLDGLRKRLSSQRHGRIRAVILISPNNPTGSVVTAAEHGAIAALARDHDIAVISDEVFGDYSLSGQECPTALRHEGALTFALGGLSKSIGLPQVKLGWIGVGGPSAQVGEALERRETICDAYLSVSAPVQVAAPDLLRMGGEVRSQIQRRTRDNLAHLRDVARGSPSCSILPVEAGWSAVIQVPAVRSEETLVLNILERTGILVHPGYFFDFEREAFLVVSLLPEPGIFSSALPMLFGEIGRAQ
jgi:alanine-synthesizing transaminase